MHCSFLQSASWAFRSGEEAKGSVLFDLTSLPDPAQLIEHKANKESTIPLAPPVLDVSVSMLMKIDDEFRSLCSMILKRSLTQDEWAAIESDDEFSTLHFWGGFDGTEMAFCFSHFADSRESWFQLTLDEVLAIDHGEITEIEVRPAEL